MQIKKIIRNLNWPIGYLKTQVYYKYKIKKIRESKLYRSVHYQYHISQLLLLQTFWRKIKNFYVFDKFRKRLKKTQQTYQKSQFFQIPIKHYVKSIISPTYILVKFLQKTNYSQFQKETMFKSLNFESFDCICDFFGDSFIFAKKKKELWFKKFIYQDAEYEKTLLYADSARMKLLYYQFVKDIQISTLPFPTQNQYIKLAAIHLYLQNCSLSFDIIQQIIPAAILQLKQREYWNCVVTQEFKEFKASIENTQSTMIQINETEEIAKVKSKGIFSSMIQSTQIQFSQIENINVDSTKAMIQFISECLKNEFCIQQLFQIVCKEALSQFGEQNLVLGIGFQGIRLYSSSKDRIWEKIDKPQSFNVFPGSIEIGFQGKKLKFETNQGFQIQSLFDEYQAIKSQNQE